VLGKVDVSELRPRIGLSSAAVAGRVPREEKVSDLVVSAGYAVLGRWRERYDDVDTDRAIDMLESLGAEHLADRTYGTLSEGERKRVLIARALMTDPELLLLDEPAAGLDLGGREELVERLGDLAADPDAPAIVLVTHHVEEIPPGFTHGLLLNEGSVVAQGLLSDVLTAENLSEAFSQSIALDRVDGRYFARRARRFGKHRSR
jgi:iron complex transport system ATP-binding protein